MQLPRFTIQCSHFNWVIWREPNKSTPFNGVGWDRETTKENSISGQVTTGWFYQPQDRRSLGHGQEIDMQYPRGLQRAANMGLWRPIVWCPDFTFSVSSVRWRSEFLFLSKCRKVFMLFLFVDICIKWLIKSLLLSRVFMFIPHWFREKNIGR